MRHDEGSNSGDPSNHPQPPDDRVDQASRESFPASDPPAFVAGGARERKAESQDEGEPGPRKRNRAGLVVTVASIWALVAAVRIPPDVMTDEGSPLVESVPLLMLVYATGAFLGLGGLIAAQRWARPARFVVGAGGIALFAGFLTLRDLALVSVLSLGLPALALLLAAPFVGEVPRSEDA
ncbi:MAG: hypothetical protein EA350_08755 [Gemmatimonadales bacterium]|nr:MAG: hypothetical protein EA350_08755 [Gemmatimonadales bacterium]